MTDAMMNKRFDRIDAQFKKIDAQFLKIDTRFERIDAQIERMAPAIVKGFDRVDHALEAKADKADLNRIYGSLDAIMKRLEINEDERTIIGFQTGRLEDWAEKAGKKINLEFTR